MAEHSRKNAHLPTKRQLIEFINDKSGDVSRREIARAFRLRGPDRTWLRETLRELEDEGVIDRQRRRRVSAPGRLPAVGIVEVIDIDEDGDVFCQPVTGRDAEPPSGLRIRLVPDRPRAPAPGEGDRVLARLKHVGGNEYEARAIRILGRTARPFVALYQSDGRGGTLHPIDRRSRTIFEVPPRHRGGARDGEYVRAEPLPGGRWENRQAKVVARLGMHDDPAMFSLLAIHSRDIPVDFPDEALREADALQEAGLDDRTDLRDLPLVTIDGADARDFDDAVWAERDPDPDNAEGWHAVVAIADVAWYVRPDSALDRAARVRGNSVYFPDRVVPMLPERLSNGMCSLRPDEDRACLAVHLWIDRDGGLKRFRFVRGLMRSTARLTYDQVQNAQDGRPDDATKPYLESVIKPLYGVYRALEKARRARGTLDLDLPERGVLLDETGAVTGIVPRARHDSHRLIEELMIAANVAAADALHGTDLPAMRRIHEPPNHEALTALRESLDGFGIRFPKGAAIRPDLFAGILKQAANTDHAQLVSDLVLRTQTQAYYGDADLGHFGLALRRYCHFTSPIRRYADLLVHRALITAFKLGEGGLSDEDIDRFEDTAELISNTERRAAAAERDAVDRYTTAFLADHVGAAFSGRVAGVTRFGLFIRLDDTGADGLVPIRQLPADWYQHDEVHHSLVGEDTGLTFTLGDPVTVQLQDADVTTGSLAFTLLEGGHSAKKKRNGRRPKRKNSASGKRTVQKKRGKRKRGR